MSWVVSTKYDDLANLILVLDAEAMRSSSSVRIGFKRSGAGSRERDRMRTTEREKDGEGTREGDGPGAKECRTEDRNLYSCHAPALLTGAVIRDGGEERSATSLIEV